MLGLKDSKDDSCCDYEPRSVVTKPNDVRDALKTAPVKAWKDAEKQQQQHLQFRDFTSMQEKKKKPTLRAGGIQTGDFGQMNTCSFAVEDQNQWRERQHEEKIDEENSVTFYNSPEQNEENSKAFMESLGSWINDLFNVPNKNPPLNAVPPKGDCPKGSVLEEDPEYLKSISAIKEQFRKKLKSETSIQVSTSDKPFEFDRVLDTGKKDRKSMTALTQSSHTEWFEDLDEQIVETNGDPIRSRLNPAPNPSELLIRTNFVMARVKPSVKNKSCLKELNNSVLVKERKKGKSRNRRDISDLEEYVFPTPSELSKRILLNVKDNEKCGKFYKNSHLAVQEAQHYSQRKSKAHQTIARCYTTNANPTDSPNSPKQKPSPSMFDQYYTTAAATVRGADDILRRNSVDLRKQHIRKPSKKDISDITRDSMQFFKEKNSKSMKNAQMETGRSDGRTSSDELVKYLMKKIKTTRPHNPRNRNSASVPQIWTSPKSRFVQSATNTIVSSVLTKNDPQLPTKAVSRGPFPSKELILKNDMRVDVSRAVTNNKYSRLTYLLEDNKMEDDSYILDHGSFRSAKRSFDDSKRDLKKNSSRMNKRLEVKTMLSKIDSKFNPFPEGKRKPKKKVEELPMMEMREEPNGRFQKQHELFKTNLKLAQMNTNTEVEAKNEAEPTNSNSPTTELAVVDTNIEMEAADSQEKDAIAEETTPEETVKANPSELDLLEFDDDSTVQKTEKQEKIFQTKSLQFLKEDPKVMLSPLEKLCLIDRESSQKGHETPLCPAEVGQVKPAETIVFNRRFSTNSLHESTPKSRPVAWCGPTSKVTMFLTESEPETNGDKKEAKEKKKVKTPRNTVPKDISSDINCGFDKVKKKPGPNCEKET